MILLILKPPSTPEFNRLAGHTIHQPWGNELQDLEGTRTRETSDGDPAYPRRGGHADDGVGHDFVRGRVHGLPTGGGAGRRRGYPVLFLVIGPAAFAFFRSLAMMICWGIVATFAVA